PTNRYLYFKLALTSRIKQILLSHFLIRRKLWFPSCSDSFHRNIIDNLLSEISPTDLDFDVIHLIAELGIKKFLLLWTGFIKFTDPFEIDLPTFSQKLCIVLTQVKSIANLIHKKRGFRHAFDTRWSKAEIVNPLISRASQY